MRLWTKDGAATEWRPWADALSGLASLPGSWDGAVLLVSESPDDELPRLVAAVRLVRRLCGRATVIAGSRHPANTWMAPLQEAGVAAFWRLNAGRPGDGRPPAAGGEALPGLVCPALHTRSADGLTVSVCGVRDDRLVLPRRQLEHFCLHDYATCPYWNEGDGCCGH